MRQIDWHQIEERAQHDLAGLVFDNEKQFANQVQAVAQQLYDVHDIRIVMVAGPSSSGKTTFCNLLSNSLQRMGVKVHHIELDDFFINRDQVPMLSSGVRDFDSPTALDLPLLRQVMNGVAHAEWVEVAKYDFITGTRREEKTLYRIQEQDVVLVEGIHALNPQLVEGVDAMKICRIGIKPRCSFLMPSGIEMSPEDLRLLRRTIRDYYTRGHSLEATLRQWGEVCRAESLYITPYINSADYNIDSCHPYELFVYKHCLHGVVDNCTLPPFEVIRQTLQQVSEIPFIEIPKGSLLNEFAIVK